MTRFHGFSLIELLISIAIIGILLSIVMLNINGTTHSYSLVNAFDSMRDDFDKIRIDSLAGKQFQGSAPLGGYGIAVPCAAGGMQINYCIFADTDGNAILDSGELITTQSVLPGNTISSVTYVSGGVTQMLQQLTMTVQPPAVSYTSQPAIAQGTAIDYFVITLQNTQTTQKKSLALDAANGLAIVNP